MARFVGVLILGFLTVALSPSLPVLAAQDAPPAAPATAPDLSEEAMDTFLRTARVVGQRNAGNGVTNSRRATFTDGVVTHDVHIQVINEEKAVFQAGGVTELNFKDSYRFNIAAYRVARLLGLRNVPMSVERRMDGKTAAVTWWVDDVQMDEKQRIERKAFGGDPARADKVSKQMQIMRVFDELIQNRDRNQGNLLWTSDFTLWMIDHTRAFRLGRELMKPNELSRCDRELLERLRGLTREAVAGATRGVLTESEVVTLMARRDAIVRHFESRIAAVGEPVVLFTFLSSPT
jgi:hypothetical protein